MNLLTGENEAGKDGVNSTCEERPSEGGAFVQVDNTASKKHQHTLPRNGDYSSAATFSSNVGAC